MLMQFKVNLDCFPSLLSYLELGLRIHHEVQNCRRSMDHKQKTVANFKELS